MSEPVSKTKITPDQDYEEKKMVLIESLFQGIKKVYVPGYSNSYSSELDSSRAAMQDFLISNGHDLIELGDMFKELTDRIGDLFPR